MNKEKILELLKTINYPGFSRDIVSFGMVDKVEVEEDSVRIDLKITTQQEDKKNCDVLHRWYPLQKSLFLFA